MTPSAVCYKPDTNVGAAVELLWSHNCGMLPVVGTDNKRLGIVTDRNHCIAMGTRNRLPGDLTVGEIAIQHVFTCKPDDEIHEAIGTMAEEQLRRLPVINDQGRARGHSFHGRHHHARRLEPVGRMLRDLSRRNHSKPEATLREAWREGSSQSKSRLNQGRSTSLRPRFKTDISQTQCP